VAQTSIPLDDPLPAPSLPSPPLHFLRRTIGLGDADLAARSDRMGSDQRRHMELLLPDDWSWSGRRVLDFGCGIGRVLRHFAPEARDAEFWGCEIHEPSVAWMREHLSPPFHIFQCSELPGLPHDDGYFDLVYATSVYTHLTDHWAGWLLEHHRVLKDDGFLFATFLGEGAIRELINEPWDEDRIGMNPLWHGNPWDSGGPIALHSPWWIRAHWGRAFELVELIPHSGDDEPEGHGVALLRKKPVELTIEDLKRLEPGEEREITALQHHVRQLTDETRLLRALLARSDDVLEEVFGSVSWRATSPLRAAKRLLSRRA
jgi:SAM-dependent methyltransferase